MKHSIVLQAPPIPLATTQPLAPPFTFLIAAVLLAASSVDQNPQCNKKKKKKTPWPLASTIKPIMEQGGWAVSRSPLPSRLSDQNKRWVSVFSRDGAAAAAGGGHGGGGGQFQGDLQPPTPPISMPVMGAQRLGSRK